MNLGTRIKMARVLCDKKQYEVANEAGITPQYLRRIESGKVNNPSKEVMEGLARSLNKTVTELFFSEVDTEDQ